MSPKDEIIEDEDETEIEEDAEEATSGLPKWMPMAVVAVAVLGFGGLVWMAFDSSSDNVSYTEVPVIKADSGDIKEKPANPGGMQIAGQDSEIFDAAAGKSPDASSQNRSSLLDEEEDREKKVEKLTSSQTPDVQAATESVKEEAKKLAAAKPASGTSETHEVTDQAVEESAKPTEIKPAIVNKNKVAAKPSDKLAITAKDKDIKSQAVAKTKSEVTTGSIKIQIGSYKSEQEAMDAWKKNVSNNKDVFSKRVFSIQKADIPGKGLYYRLQVGGFATSSDASSTCKTLSTRKTACFVVR